MIDIHCHILPDIDDGSKSWDESIQMAKVARDDGTRAIITTPHWIEGSNWEPGTELIKEKVEQLNKRLADENIDLKVYPGMEIGITENLMSYFSNGRLLKLAGSTLALFETPYYSLPIGVDEIIFQLTSQDITPVFAHPERNIDFQNNPESIIPFVDKGALVQVTAFSFLGRFGPDAEKCVKDFAKMGLIDFIASDGHSADKRPPLISKGLEAWKNISGDDEVKNKLLESFDYFDIE